MRNLVFAENEYYHICNRGVDKRNIFSDTYDVSRFLQSMEIFNTNESVGSIYEKTYNRRGMRAKTVPLAAKPLIECIAYCLNPNHFHFILRPLTEKGVERFMHKMGSGYSKYFNTKHKRSGALFQGKFRANHIDSNEYLLYVSTYVNLNDRAHAGNSLDAGGTLASSWDSYANQKEDKLCNPSIILDQFQTREKYIHFAKNTLETIIARKKSAEGELEFDLLET